MSVAKFRAKRGQRHLGLGSKERMLETHTLQAHLVSILLEHAQEKTQIATAVSELQGACKRFFSSSRRSRYYSPSPVVLDALIVLYKENASFRKELMSCILLLSLSSIQAWNRVATSAFFRIFPNSAHLLGKVAIAKNSCWTHWSQAEQEKCASACMALSDPDICVKDDYLGRTTPLSISIRGFKTMLGELREPFDKSDLKSDIVMLVHRIPPRIWNSLRYCDFSFLLDSATEAEVSKAMCMSNTSVRPEIRARRIRKSTSILQRYGLFTAVDVDAEPDLVQTHNDQLVDRLLDIRHCLNLIEKSAHDMGSITDREAYDIALMSSNESICNALQMAAKEWIKQGRVSLVSAAYVAAPKLLNQLAGYLPVDGSSIRSVPRSYISPLDREIDRALCTILRCVPELSAYFYNWYAEDQNRYSDLKKAALMYPLLVLRRTKCLCAAGQTLLAGLTNPSDRYNLYTLRALETLISVFIVLPGSPKLEVEDFCVSTLEFVLEEKRVDYGIPDFLTSLLVSILRFLRRCELKGRKTKLIRCIDSVLNANCSNAAVAENASELRSYLVGNYDSSPVDT